MRSTVVGVFGGRWDIALGGQKPAVEEKLEGIDVVVGALLEVKTVVAHLLLGLLGDHPPSNSRQCSD